MNSIVSAPLGNTRLPRHGSFLKEVLSQARLFLVFSLFTCSLPIIFCLIASLIQPNGSQAVLALGYVVPFLMAFLQIAFTVSMIMVAKLTANRPLVASHHHLYIHRSNFWSSIWLSLLLGLIMSLCYALSTSLYIYFANNKPNTQATLTYGLDFTWQTVGFVIVIPVVTTLMMRIFMLNKNHALAMMGLLFLAIVALALVLGLMTNLKAAGIGLGTTVAALVVLVLQFSYLYRYQGFLFGRPAGWSPWSLLTMRLILKESLTSISLSVFKGVAIVALAFAIPLTISDFVPLSYQMARVLWFNLMYFLPFIGLGIGEIIRFHYLFHDGSNQCDFQHSLKTDLGLIFGTLLLTLALSVGAVFVVAPLARLYSRHDFNPFASNLAPEIAGWGQPTVPPQELVNLEELQQLELTPLPHLEPLLPLTGDPQKDIIIKLQNAAIQLANANKISQWLNLQIQNNPTVFAHLFANLNQWNAWLNQTNSQGVKLIDFLGIKEPIKAIIASWIAGNDEWQNQVLSLLPLFKSTMSYFVHLWLYACTDPTITSAFINPRWLISVPEFLAQYGFKNGVLNWRQSNIVALLPALFLQIQTFSAKSIFYILIFANLNAVWAIILQTNARDLKKSLPHWLMLIVYLVCVGGLVTFGALFAVTFKTQLGSTNPFQYLDAWTFPLVLIAVLAILVVLAKAIQANRLKMKS